MALILPYLETDLTVLTIHSAMVNRVHYKIEHVAIYWSLYNIRKHVYKTTSTDVQIVSSHCSVALKTSNCLPYRQQPFESYQLYGRGPYASAIPIRPTAMYIWNIEMLKLACEEPVFTCS